MRRWMPAALAGLFFLTLGYALGDAGRTRLEAARLLLDVFALAQDGGADPRATPPAAIRYPGPGGETRVADLYCPGAAPPGARLLLAHGLVEDGKDDPRLRALGAALSRHRFLVMVPDFPGMRALRAGEEDIAEVEAALEALAGIAACETAAGAAPAPDRVPPDDAGLPTGAVGFSYSAGPVLLALDRRPPRAGFAIIFGGYFDLAEVIRFLTTGRHRDEGQEREGEALPQGRWILLGANAARLGSPADRAALDAISRRRRADPQSDIADLAAGLGPEAASALALLSNTDPERFDDLLKGVSPALRRTLLALSPGILSRPLPIDLDLLHGRADAVIPYTQTLALARHTRVTGEVRMALLGGFRHARADGGDRRAAWLAGLGHPGDSLRLLAILEGLLRRRVAPGPPARARPPAS